VKLFLQIIKQEGTVIQSGFKTLMIRRAAPDKKKPEELKGGG
jgi:hypothetical protein